MVLYSGFVGCSGFLADLQKLLKITCYKYLFVRILQLLTAIILFLFNVCDISYLETLVDKKSLHVTLSHQVTNASLSLYFLKMCLHKTI